MVQKTSTDNEQIRLYVAYTIFTGFSSKSFLESVCRKYFCGCKQVNWRGQTKAVL